MTFDLTRASGWEALAKAYRAANAADEAAVDAFCAAENAAMADPDHRDVAPNETHSDSVARTAHNREVAERYGYSALDAKVHEASTARCDLLDAALAAPAPNLAALGLKLDMIADSGGWNDFDNESWSVFVADLRRLCGLTQTQEPRQ